MSGPLGFFLTRTVVSVRPLVPTVYLTISCQVLTHNISLVCHISHALSLLFTDLLTETTNDTDTRVGNSLSTDTKNIIKY